MSLSVAEFRQITRSHRRTTHCRRPMSLHHRHRIDEHLDTLLANQTISDGEATDHCQKVTPQDGGLAELIVARSWFHCRYCPCGLHTRTHTQSADGPARSTVLVRGTMMSQSCVTEFRQITRSHRRTTHCRRPMSLHTGTHTHSLQQGLNWGGSHRISDPALLV